MTSLPWTDEELRASIEAYLKMLVYEKTNTPFVKAEINRQLQGKINRSKSSIEMRFQNISAVLKEHKQSYVKGYAPLGNVGGANKEKIWQMIQKLQNAV